MKKNRNFANPKNRVKHIILFTQFNYANNSTISKSRESQCH